MNRRIASNVLFAFSLCVPLFAYADSPSSKEDRKAKPPTLEGAWVIHSMEQVGRVLEGDKLPATMRDMKRVFEKERLTIKNRDREYTCTFTVKNNTTPKHMDVTIASDGRKPRTLKCIYEIKDGKLRLAESRDERPESFKTDRTMRRIIVYTFSREKKGTKAVRPVEEQDSDLPGGKPAGE